MFARLKTDSGSNFRARRNLASKWRTGCTPAHGLRRPTSLSRAQPWNVPCYPLGRTASSLEEIAQSTVSNGVVTLEGDVDFWSQREDADRAVRNLVGVGSVDNRIQIRSTKASREINDAIHDRVET